MGRLFWKFFIFFWLAQLSTGIGIGVTIWLQSQAPDPGAAAVDASPPALFVVSAAAATLRHGGVAALRELIDERSREPGPRLVAVDENRHSLFAGSDSPAQIDRVRALAAEPERHAGVESVLADDGHRYLLFVVPHAHPPPPEGGAPHRPPPPPHRRSFLPPLLPIVAGALVSLVFAALLAWYFAKPIRSLRSAFASAANGNLTQHLAPLMGKRRDELADLGRDFDRMALQLGSLMNGQRRLLHDVSHELRSPLARLQAAIGLARQQPERIDDSLLRIDRESVRMDKLVSELLALSRIEAGMAGQFEETVDVNEVLGNVVEDAAIEAAAGQSRIELRIGEAVFVRGNSELLYRAAENVVRNAIKYSPPAGVIRVSVVRQGDEVIVRIADQGPGVAAADLAAIFAPFFRSKSESSADGHGLGLAIAQRVIESMQGRIAAANLPAGGLAVTIALPRLTTP